MITVNTPSVLASDYPYHKDVCTQVFIRQLNWSDKEVSSYTYHLRELAEGEGAVAIFVVKPKATGTKEVQP